MLRIVNLTFDTAHFCQTLKYILYRCRKCKEMEVCKRNSSIRESPAVNAKELFDAVNKPQPTKKKRENQDKCVYAQAERRPSAAGYARTACVYRKISRKMRFPYII